MARKSTSFPTRARPLAAWAAACLAAVLAACSVVDSALVGAPGGSATCKSRLGYYHLARSVIDVTVTEVKEVTLGQREDGSPIEATVISHEIGVGAPRPVADFGHTYCLDYLASLTSDDEVKVTLTKDGLLRKITSKTEDRSVDIAKTLLRTLFTLISGDPTFRAAGEVTRHIVRREVLKVSYDPLDEEEARTLNTRLEKFNFCLIADDRASDELRMADYRAYCSSPKQHGKVSHAAYRDAGFARPRHKHRRHDRDEENGHGEASPPAFAEGILYRPHLPYAYMLLERERTTGKPRWVVRKREKMLLENASPIIQVDIKRAAFTNRETVLVFDNGRLDDIALSKGSELAAFMQIPIYVVQSLIALPASIIKVQIDNTKNQKLLSDAEGNLLAALLSEQKCRKELDAVAANTSDGSQCSPKN